VVRRASPDDLDLFLALAGAKCYPEVRASRLTSERHRELVLQQYRHQWSQMLERPDLAVLLSEEDFCVFLNDEARFADQSQAWLWDFGTNPAPFMPALLELAARHQAQYLLTRVAPAPGGQPTSVQLRGIASWVPEAPGLRAVGFAPENTRVIQRLEHRSTEGAYTLRRVVERDRVFITNLNCQAVKAYDIPQRAIKQEDLSARNLEIYLNLDLGRHSEVVGYVVEDDDRPVGYILFKLRRQLELTGEAAAYIYDINLLPSYWGTSARRLLLHHAQNKLLERGCVAMYGDVSCDNPNALVVAIRAAGFDVYWTRWGRKV
jgi:GNAT superfamily N-acetyltransferase